MCVWCVSWYQLWSGGFYCCRCLLVCPGKYVGLLCERVSACPVFPSEPHMTFSREGKCPICVRPITASCGPHALPKARPTHLCSKHSRPRAPSSPLSVVFVVPSSSPLRSDQQKNTTRTFSTWLWLRTCTSVWTDRRGNVKQMFRWWGSTSWVWTDDPRPLTCEQTDAWLCGNGALKHVLLSLALHSASDR